MNDSYERWELALSEGRRVAFEFHASWCSMCHALRREVLDTPAARPLLDGVERVGIDFDAAKSRGLVERLAILELPTVVVLGADGVERGRMVGYETAAAWLAEARATLAREDDPLVALEGQLDSRESRLRYAEICLARAPGKAVRLLEELAWGEDDAAAWALHLLGRYFHRAKRDPARARHVWRELASRFPDSDLALGAIEWHARAQAELGHPELGSAGFRAHASDSSVIAQWARWAGRLGYEPARAEIREAAMSSMGRARGPAREDLERLVMELGRPFEPSA